MKKSKKIMIYVSMIFLLCVCICLGCCTLLHTSPPKGSVPIGQILAVYDPELHIPAQNAGVLVLPGGELCQLSRAGDLDVAGEGIQSNVNKMLPTENGILYTVDQTLYYWEKNGVTMIADGVSAFAGVAQKILYGTKEGLLYLYENGGATLVTAFADDGVLQQIFACKDYTVVITSQDAYVSVDGGDFNAMGLRMGTPQQFFMHGEWLVIVGDGSTGAVAHHIRHQTALEIDLGFYTCEHSNQIAVAGDGRWVYLSLHSKIWPQFDEELHTATYRIDPDDWSVERISDDYYDSLLCSEDVLYGINATGKDFSDYCYVIAKNNR